MGFRDLGLRDLGRSELWTCTVQGTVPENLGLGVCFLGKAQEFGGLKVE